MKFDYEKKKSQYNKIKHGIDFEEAQAMWKDPDLVEATLFTTGERRRVFLGISVTLSGLPTPD